MDPNSSDPQSGQNSQSSLQSELTHATEEMYKKNVELNERNKTLSLLRKIDEIVLSTVTDPHQVAQKVATAIVSEAVFKGLVVFELNNNDKALLPLADSYEGAENEGKLYAEKLSLTLTGNALVKSVNERRPYLVGNLSEIVLSDILKQELSVLQQSAGIKMVVAFPLIVRNSVIGAIGIMLGENYEKLTESQKDLILRLTGVIGISLDNALLYKQIEDANEKLKELDKLKDEFVSLASHELRTPMTVIKSYIWLLLQGKAGELSEKQKTYLDRTYASTDRLINMVNDMLNISRIESGRFTIEPKPFDLASLIQETVSEMQTRAKELGVYLAFENPALPLPKVLADNERIKQVLINLIGNSLKFTPQNGNISITTSVKDEFITTSVKDTGKGINPQDMDKLFRKFNMLGSNYLTKQSGQGTGLGLYLSKALVEMHHGRIGVVSDGEGRGSTFSFTLPIAMGA